MSHNTEVLLPPEACPYLEEQHWRLAVLQQTQFTTEQYAHCLERGYRRTGCFLYRPACADCAACVPCRINVQSAKLRRRHRRILKRNRDLSVKTQTPFVNLDLVRLYEQYIIERHRDGDMYPPDIERFMNFVDSDWASTTFLCGFEDNRLQVVAVTDVGPDYLSAVYTFYSPFSARRSFGVWAVLQQIEYAKSMNVPYLYLGFWIKASRKMSYKINLPGCELYDRQRGWLPVDKFLPND